MKGRLSVSLAALAVGLVAAPVCAGQDLTIAVVGPMTGVSASMGEQLKHGAEAAAAAINEAGGVNGRKITIVVQDDACDAGRAVAVANMIVDQHIKFVDGHACSVSSIPAAEVYAGNTVLMMSPASSNPALTEKGYPTIMRLFGRDDAQGAFIGQWIAQKYKGKKVAVLHDKEMYGESLATAVKDTMNKAGLTEAMFEGLNPDMKDYSAAVLKLKQAGVEFVFFGGGNPGAGTLPRLAADQGYAMHIMGGDALAQSEFWQTAGPAGEGALFTFPADPRHLPSAAKALEQFKALNYNPEGYTLFSYGVVQAIAEGVKRAGSDDPKAVVKALESGEAVETVLGSVKFDAKGDIKDPGYDINMWHAGQYAPITP